MKFLKKTLAYMLPAMMLLGGTSCSDFLDKAPENKVPEESIDYTNLANMYQPVSGVYAQVRTGGLHWISLAAFIVRDDDVWSGRHDDQADLVSIGEKFLYSNGWWGFNETWNQHYAIIRYANAALQDLESFKANITSEADMEKYRTYCGEVRFLRAYAYYRLTQCFGDVVIFSDNNQTDMTRSKRDVVYQYMLQEDLEYAINNLIKHGLIITGNYNKLPMDRTKWYSLTDKAYEELKEKNPISEFSEMDLLKSGNGFLKIQEPIPDVNSNITADINNDSSLISSESIEKKDINSSNDSFISKEKLAKSKEPQGIRPSKEEVEAFIKERGYHITYQDMDDYYTNYGKYPFWMMMSQKKAGKEPPFVRSWKGCCKTFEDNWKRRNGDKPAHTEAKNPYSYDPDDPENKRIRERQLKEMRELGYVV